MSYDCFRRVPSMMCSLSSGYLLGCQDILEGQLLLVQLPEMDFISAEGTTSRLQAPGNAKGANISGVKRIKKQRLVQPPIEAFVLRRQSTSKQLLAEVQAEIRSMYVMLAEYKVCRLPHHCHVYTCKSLKIHVFYGALWV